MRTVKLQMQITLDGFVAGPKGEQDWMVKDWDEELNNYVSSLTENMDCILLGRKLAEKFIPFWKSFAEEKPEDEPEKEFARKIHETEKVVFTRNPKEFEERAKAWQATRLANDTIEKELSVIKTSPGKDIVVYGGATYVSELIRCNLIDEYHFFINPVAIGEGLSVFSGLEGRRQLELVSSRKFDCGIVALFYKPKK